MGHLGKANLIRKTQAQQILELETEKEMLVERLETVADLLQKHGFLGLTPHERYVFTHGIPTNSLQHKHPDVAVFTDKDGLPSQVTA